MKKVLIIGLDGARPDSILAANAPNIKQLASEGCFSWRAQTELLSFSGPAWTSLLTGVHQDKHGVNMNLFMSVLRKVPTFFMRIKEWRPETKVIVHSHWEPIITELIEKEAMDISSTGPDEVMARRMADDIANGKGDIHFIQLDDIDAAGHANGYSPTITAYVKKIEEIDSMVGWMLKEVAYRKKTEDWLVCLVSDHGGNLKAHGGMTLGELTIAFIINGLNITCKGEIPGDEECSPRIVDIVPNVAKFLGMPVDPIWDGTFICIG